jgi:hypothetical protein
MSADHYSPRRDIEALPNIEERQALTCALDELEKSEKAAAAVMDEIQKADRKTQLQFRVAVFFLVFVGTVLVWYALSKIYAGSYTHHGRTVTFSGDPVEFVFHLFFPVVGIAICACGLKSIKRSSTTTSVKPKC